MKYLVMALIGWSLSACQSMSAPDQTAINQVESISQNHTHSKTQSIIVKPSKNMAADKFSALLESIDENAKLISEGSGGTFLVGYSKLDLNDFLERLRRSKHIEYASPNQKKR